MYVYTPLHMCAGGVYVGVYVRVYVEVYVYSYVYDINTQHTVFAYTMFHFCTTDRDSIILEANHLKVKSKQTTLFCNIVKMYARRTEYACCTICADYLSNIGLVYTIFH